jgi:streptomycin 6-kinase
MDDVELPRLLVESVSRHGPPERAEWLAELPRMVTRLADRWRLRLGPPFQPGGMTGWVAPAVRGGEHLVLKVRWHGSEREESLHEPDGLRAWDGRGTVRLLDSHKDGPTTALLLEACEPGTPLAEALPEEKQDVVLCRLLRQMWIEPPAGSPFRALADMCVWWADRAEAKGVPDAGLAREGLGLFRSLPLDPMPATLLATDLHPGNVLAAKREPWLVIDPKPYVGDPHYDALQRMLNFEERLHADPAGFVQLMAGLLDLDTGRLRLWLFARCIQESPDDPGLLAVARRVAP